MFAAPSTARLSSAAISAPSAFSSPSDLACDVVDGRNDIDRQADTVAAIAAHDTQLFGGRLFQALAGAGIRTERAIVLAVLPDSSVGVVGAHPDKVKLERLFVDDSELFNQFHVIARQNDMVASAEICRRYLQDSYNAQGEGGRLAVWRRYRALCDQMESMAGRLTLAAGQLMSGALQFTVTALAQ